MGGITPELRLGVCRDFADELKGTHMPIDVLKQRNDSWEGRTKLWFDSWSLRFCDDRTSLVEPHELTRARTRIWRCDMNSDHHVIDFRGSAKRTSWLHREEPPKWEKAIPAPHILRKRVCGDGLCTQGGDYRSRPTSGHRSFKKYLPPTAGFKGSRHSSTAVGRDSFSKAVAALDGIGCRPYVRSSRRRTGTADPSATFVGGKSLPQSRYSVSGKRDRVFRSPRRLR